MSYWRLMELFRRLSVTSRSGNGTKQKIHWLVDGIMRLPWKLWDGMRAMIASKHIILIVVMFLDQNFNHIMFNMKLLREMIKSSKAWAQARGLVETSEIHGKEEWRIPTTRTFEHNKINGSERRQQMSFTAEDTYMSKIMIYRYRYDVSYSQLGLYWSHDGRWTGSSGGGVPLVYMVMWEFHIALTFISCTVHAGVYYW